MMEFISGFDVYSKQLGLAWDCFSMSRVELGCNTFAFRLNFEFWLLGIMTETVYRQYQSGEYIHTHIYIYIYIYIYII